MHTCPWERVEALFADALAHPPGARPAFLDGAGLEPALRAEVASLLAAHEASGGFLERTSALARLLDALAWPDDAVRGGAEPRAQEVDTRPFAGPPTGPSA